MVLTLQEALDGEFCYDDGAAIVKNADVNGNNSNATVDIWRHDFWGQDLRNESSHKSYRPVTTLSFLWQYRLSKGSPRAFHAFNLACHVCVTTLVGLVTSTILRGTHAPTGLEVTEDGVEAGAEAPVRGGKGETASPKKVAFMLPVQKKGGELKVAVGGSNGTDRAGRDRSPRNGSPRRRNAACDGPEGLDKTLSRGNDVDVAKDEDLSRAACARWACAIFGTHPVHVEAVANIVSRAEVLSALFYLSAFLSYRHAVLAPFACTRAASRATPAADGGLAWRGRQRAVWFLVACVLASAAVLCKETALTALGLFVVEEALSLRRLQCWGGYKGAAVRLGLIGSLCGVYLRLKAGLTGVHFMPRIASVDNSAVNAPTPIAVVLSVLQIHSVYLSRLAVPITLSCDYSPNTLPNILSPWESANLRWVCAYAILFVCLSYAVWRAVRRGDDFLVRASAWLIIPFGLSANVIFPVATVVGERLLYLPSAGFCMALSWALTSPDSPVAGLVLARHGRVTWTAVSVCALYFARTVARVPVWHDTTHLFAVHATSIVPKSIRMHHGLALELARQGHHARALPAFRQALALLNDTSYRHGIRPSQQAAELHGQYHFEAANSLSELDMNEFPGARAEAQALYRAAVSLVPSEFKFHNRLAFNLVQQRSYSDALGHFEACFLLRPTNADMVNNIGNIYMATRRVEMALRAYTLGLRLNPADGDNLYNMGSLLLRFPERTREAATALRRARRLIPADPEVGQALNHALALLHTQRREQGHRSSTRHADSQPAQGRSPGARKKKSRQRKPTG